MQVLSAHSLPPPSSFFLLLLLQDEVLDSIACFALRIETQEREQAHAN
jgi:hypothetical protein